MAWQRYTDTIVFNGNGQTVLRYFPTALSPKRWKIISAFASWFGSGTQTSTTLQFSIVSGAGIVFANLLATPQLQATLAGAASIGQGLVKDSEAPTLGTTIGTMPIPDIELGLSDSFQITVPEKMAVGSTLTMQVHIAYDNCDGNLPSEVQGSSSHGPYAGF